MTQQYIDILFDGPPSSESGRFIEVEDETGNAIAAGEWVKSDKPDEAERDWWRLRLSVKPSLGKLAEKIHQRATESGFWPEDKQRALEALHRLRFWAPQHDGDPGEHHGPIDDIALIQQYVEAQSIRNMGEMLMLATSELAEALEEHRSGKKVHYHAIRMGVDTDMSDPKVRAAWFRIRDAQMLANEKREEYTPNVEDIGILVAAGIAKPEGLAVELADCIIRCLDTMKSLNVDIDAVVAEKMIYNASRGFKHGKAY